MAFRRGAARIPGRLRFSPTIVHRDVEREEGPGAHYRRLAFCFGVHDHQPVATSTASPPRPRPAPTVLFELVRRRPEVRLTCTSTEACSVAARARTRRPSTARRDRGVGQVELLTGGYWEPPRDPARPRQGRPDPAALRLPEAPVRRAATRHVLAGASWEPACRRRSPRPRREYVLVDDSISRSRIRSRDPRGWYLTEDQGATVGVVPISQRLRYLIPFAASTTASASSRPDTGRCRR